MDMKPFAGRNFVKVDNVRGRPIEGTIVDISEGDYGKLNLTLDTGDTLSLNKKNTARLVRAFGSDSNRALGQKVRLLLVERKQDGNVYETALLEPIVTADVELVEKKPFDDDIPQF